MSNSIPVPGPGGKENPKYVGIFNPSFDITRMLEALNNSKNGEVDLPYDLDAASRGAEETRQAAEEAGNKEEVERAALLLKRIDEIRERLKKTVKEEDKK